MNLEKVLLAAHYVLFGRIPKTNRTGIPRLSRNENFHPDLKEIGNLMFDITKLSFTTSKSIVYES